MSRFFPLSVVVLVFAASLLGGCGKKPQPGIPPRPITTAVVEQRDVPLYIDSIGSCAALFEVSIQPQVTGQLIQAHFSQGEDVKQGKLLFTIDPRPFKAALDKAVATLAFDTAQLELKSIQLRRSKELVPGGFISSQDLDTLIADVASAKAQVDADRAAVDTARINLDFCYITAPVEGRTGFLLIDIGNIVAPAPSSSTLVSIQTISPLYVDFVAMEKELPVVRKYASAKPLQVEASMVEDPNNKRTGELYVIDNTVQKATGTVKLRAIFTNEDKFFWPAQFVNVRLILDTIKGALLVPNECVKTGQKGEYVFVVKPDSTAELRFVKVGQRQGEKTVIQDGVKPGETVVLTGQLLLSPGAKVIDLGKMGQAGAKP